MSVLMQKMIEFQQQWPLKPENDVLHLI